MFQYCEKKTHKQRINTENINYSIEEMLKQEAFPKMGVSRVTHTTSGDSKRKPRAFG